MNWDGGTEQAESTRHKDCLFTYLLTCLLNCLLAGHCSLTKYIRSLSYLALLPCFPAYLLSYLLTLTHLLRARELNRPMTS